MGKLFKYGLIGFGLLVVLVAVFGKKGGEAGNAGSSSASMSSSGTSGTNAVASHRVDESFRLGDFSYSVGQPVVRQRIGNQMFGESANPGAVFVTIPYAERNEGNESHVGAGSPLELRDAQGRTFRPSSRVETAMMMAGGHAQPLPELQPGVQVQGVAGFEVPEAVAHGALTIVVKERGVFSSGEAVVAAVLP